MVTHWLMGYLSSPESGEAKGLPRMGVEPLLYRWYMTYMVMWHHMRHLPGIRYDAYDITSQAMAIGGKPSAIALPARNSHTGQLGDRNQGPVGLDYQCTGSSGKQRSGYSLFTVTHFIH